MYIICGLGNPGKQYENTRHNVGFKAVDILGNRSGISINKNKFRALIGEGRLGNQKVLLVKPQTYMNLSGESLREVVNYYKVPMENVIVIYDDFDIPAGNLRIRKSGSAGTHNGMRSIVKELKSTDFPRIRIGTGAKEKGDIIDFVISKVPKSEQQILGETEERTADAVECLLEQGIDMAMNRYNTKKAKKPKKPKETEVTAETKESGESKGAENSEASQTRE